MSYQPEGLGKKKVRAPAEEGEKKDGKKKRTAEDKL